MANTTYNETLEATRVVETGGNTLSASAAAVTTSAAVALAADPNRVLCWIQNTGAADAFIGGSGVTTGTGYKIAAGGYLPFPVRMRGDIYAIGAGATTLRFWIEK